MAARVHSKFERLTGVLLAFAFLFIGGESYLRIFPPRDLHPYLGNDSPLMGNLVPDANFGVGFASFSTLQEDNPTMLHSRSPLQPSADASKVWLILGSSFGFELAAHIGRNLPEQRVMTLDRREKPNVRMAQVKTLLEGGSRPGHIYLVLIRPDFATLGEFELEHQTANAHGGHVFEPRMPPGFFGEVTTHCRLAFTGWSRLGLHKDQPDFRTSQLGATVPETLRHDLDKMLGALGELSKHHGVPITLVPIPERRTVLKKLGFALEDTLAALARKHDLGCCDARALFLAHPRPEELYVPDGHLSEVGNAAVLREMRSPSLHQPDA